MRMKMKMFTGCVALALAAGSASAVTLLDWQDGSAGKEYDASWVRSALDGFTETGTANTGVAGAGIALGSQQAIQITANTADNFSIQAAKFSTTAFSPANMLAYGPDNAEIAGVSFEFYAGSGAPAGLGFFFQSGDNHWYYDINPVNSSGWQTYEALLTFGGSGWYGYANDDFITDLTLSNFNTDLAAVDRLGLYIYYNVNQSGQEYGIANFGLTVPEPETYLALAVALLSVAFVFRRKITESLEEARMMLQM